MNKTPRIGITLGDPNGIGPEITAKAVCSAELKDRCELHVYGSRVVFRAAEKLVGMDGLYKFHEISGFEDEHLKPGTVDKTAGKASLEYINAAVTDAVNNKIDAIVTAPISKESIHAAGSVYPGHTEMLRDMTGAGDVVMAFSGGNFMVALVTIHVALKQVPELITRDKVLNTIRVSFESLKNEFSINNPRIVVCGLNPHAGEAGAFGTEEIEHILPAIEVARKGGIDVTGPLPADTLFYQAKNGRWDLVVAMYHDQGLIPFKMLAFDVGVNVTLGLPIIRTSPDHGTAFDIAWQGKADPTSMIEAISLAATLAQNRIK